MAQYFKFKLKKFSIIINKLFYIMQLNIKLIDHKKKYSLNRENELFVNIHYMKLFELNLIKVSSLTLTPISEGLNFAHFLKENYPASRFNKNLVGTRQHRDRGAILCPFPPSPTKKVGECASAGSIEQALPGAEYAVFLVNYDGMRGISMEMVSGGVWPRLGLWMRRSCLLALKRDCVFQNWEV